MNRLQKERDALLRKGEEVGEGGEGRARGGGGREWGEGGWRSGRWGAEKSNSEVSKRAGKIPDILERSFNGILFRWELQGLMENEVTRVHPRISLFIPRRCRGVRAVKPCEGLSPRPRTRTVKILSRMLQR